VLNALKKKGAFFFWREEHQAVFESLKEALCKAPVLQIPDFSKQLVLVTDASNLAISAVLQRVQGELAPVAYYSRVLTDAEKKYSTYEKECLAVIFGCEKCRTYLEHSVFELHCDNLAVCWLLKKVKDVGHLGRWLLRLAPFNFSVKHTKGVENVVADALSRKFEGTGGEGPEITCAALLESLPLVYSSLQEIQMTDDWCAELRKKILDKQPNVDSFVIYKELLAYFPKKAKRRRWVVPCSLRKMMLKYFHNGVLSGHLGRRKLYTGLQQIFGGPKCEAVFDYVMCELCVRAKQAQITKVGMHDARPSLEPMEKLFIDFFGPVVRSKRGNIAILVVVDAFSKFVTFYPVRRMVSRVVIVSKGVIFRFMAPLNLMFRITRVPL
jgi:hypothetical protein